MNLFSFMRLGLVILITLGLTGCGKSESYRYKLTLAVNTPDGVKSGSSVVEASFWDVSIPARGTMHKLRGEALHLDLGPGVRPLIALLTSQLHLKFGKEHSWTRETGPNDSLLARLYGKAPTANYMDDVPRIAQMRGPRKITTNDLPDLVTFADVNDPKSVIEVDPNNLQATLGPNVTWNEITLEMTDEPVTTGIVQKLTWLPAYFNKNLRLDGSDLGTGKTLANTLSWPDFDQSGKSRNSM